jgi:hypothetical protein
MKQKKPKTYPLVWIQWWDAAAHNEWADVADVQEDVPVDLITTVGFLVKEDEKAYYVVATICGDMANNQMSLPKGMVKSIQIGRFAEKRKKKIGTQPIQDAVRPEHIQE